jgi:hypothetical protein
MSGVKSSNHHTLTVRLAPTLSNTTYSALSGQPLNLPADGAARPSGAATAMAAVPVDSEPAVKPGFPQLRGCCARARLTAKKEQPR